MKKNAKHKLGFTLIEVMTSMVILAVLAGGIFATISFSKRVAIRNQEKSIAISLVEQRLNEIKTSSQATNIQRDTVFRDVLNRRVEFTRISEDEDSGDRFREVEVTVTWTDQAGADRTVSAATALFGT